MNLMQNSKNSHMKNVSKIVGLLMLGAVAVSCGNVKNVAYFQDAQPQTPITAQIAKTLTVGVSDKISIVVHSKDPELAAIFNLPVAAQRVGMTSSSGVSGGSNQMSTYTVDNNGNIDFPILGPIHVAGLRREDIAKVIKDQITSKNYIKDPIVTVEFANLYISVIGDVSHPGRFMLEKDKVTLIDAIANAGDLAITGQRENIKVFREENGKQHCYNVDLTNAEALFNSPVYYLRQDDVIYVEPNKMRKRQSTVNGNNISSASFWMSVASLLASLTGTALSTYFVFNNYSRR